LTAQVTCVELQLQVPAHLHSHLLRSSRSLSSNGPFTSLGVHLLSNNNSNNSNNSNSSNIHSNFSNSSNSNNLNDRVLFFSR
ncbi:hypothetical protein CLOP_g467, partial [Closterium sp. NIES-67]